MKIRMQAIIGASVALLISTGYASAQSSTKSGAAPGTNTSDAYVSKHAVSHGSVSSNASEKQKTNQTTGAPGSTMKPMSKQKGNQAKTAPNPQ